MQHLKTLTFFSEQQGLDGADCQLSLVLRTLVWFQCWLNCHWFSSSLLQSVALWQPTGMTLRIKKIQFHQKIQCSLSYPNFSVKKNQLLFHNSITKLEWNSRFVSCFNKSNRSPLSLYKKLLQKQICCPWLQNTLATRLQFCNNIFKLEWYSPFVSCFNK